MIITASNRVIDCRLFHLKKLGAIINHYILVYYFVKMSLVPLTSTINFWNDETVELNSQRNRKTIPEIPAVGRDLQTIRGSGIEKLAYLALQIVKSEDKAVIIRAIASASSILLSDSTNFTGAKNPSVELTGLEVAEREDTPGEQILKTNFEDESDVRVDELLALMMADPDELGSYFGLLFVAGNKRVDSKNRSAFNEKRQASATASIIGEPVIFVNDSIYLTDFVLTKVYASFLSYSPVRANITTRIVQQLNKSHMGPSLAFVNMFLLLVDSGLSALRIIKEAVIKHDWIRTDFPELKAELAAANNAQNILKGAPGHERSFLKAIHGNQFVPVMYSDIDNLLGVCKEVLVRSTPSYANYRGGKTTEDQVRRVQKRMNITEDVVEQVVAE